jgi:hypothetical protein
LNIQNNNLPIKVNSSKSKKLIKNIITSLIVIISTYLAFSGVNYKILFQNIIQANYLYIVLPIPIMLLSHWFRAIRWKTILKPFYQAPNIRNLFSAVMIGYAINNILPRGGEIVRPFIYSKQEKISFSSTFATIILERLLDVFTLLILFGATFILFSDKILSLLPPSIDFGKIVYLSLSLLIILIFSFYPPFFHFLLAKLVKPISNKLYEKLIDIFDKFRKGFAIIKEPSMYFKLFMESSIIWFFYSLPLFIMFYAFDFSSQGLNFLDAVLLLVASGISFSIAPTPGSIGVFNWIVKIILVKFYGISGEQALAYATVNHGVNYLVQILVGGFYIYKDKAWHYIFNISFKKEDKLNEES